MTKEDYLKNHIPHRVNLLITFKERFSNLTEGQMEQLGLRDFYRCSKDISIMMVRFFLEELGIILKMNTGEIIGVENLKNEKKIKQFLERIKKLGLKKLTLNDINNDMKLKSDIIEILIAANRAVAHIDEGGVNHNLDSYPKTLKMLIPVIDYTVQKISSNIYITEKAYQDAMSLDENKMNRKNIKTENEK